MRTISGSGLGLFLLLASIGGAYGAYTTGTAFPTIVVDNSAGDQSNPHVSGNYAAYNVVTTIGANIIGFYNFSAATRSTVPTAANSFDNLSHVNGSNIVFTRISTISGASSIVKYSISSGTSTEVAPVAPPALALRGNPAIGNNTIAWEDIGVSSVMSSEIVLSTDGITTTRVTNDTLPDQNTNVSPAGDVVVWEKCFTQCDIYAALAPAWAPQVVANSAANETWPHTNGTQIVYASNAGGVVHVYVTTLSGVASQIPSPTVTQDHPAIANNFVAYEGGTSTSHDIYVYDLTTGVTRQITNTPADNELLSDITVSGNTVRVVWQVNGGATGHDVYASEFTTQCTPDQIVALIAQVAGLNLDPQTASQLTSLLQSALANITPEKRPIVCNLLNVFINKVNALRGTKLTPAQADQLISIARCIRSAIGCP
jgi:hypothetical protein